MIYIPQAPQRRLDHMEIPRLHDERSRLQTRKNTKVRLAPRQVPKANVLATLANAAKL